MRTVALTLITCLFAASPVLAQSADSGAAARKPQWLAVLSLARPALSDPANWTAEDQAKVMAHFNYHTDLARRGVVIFGGRTQDTAPNGHMPADTMGLVVLEAVDQAEAEAVMAADPAVSGGVMNVRVRPYSIAFRRAD
jgi:uncharacterized protein YciI